MQKYFNSLYSLYSARRSLPPGAKIPRISHPPAVSVAAGGTALSFKMKMKDIAPLTRFG